MSIILGIKKHEKIFFVGIGGVSMSALARFMRNFGYQVAGSDKTDSSAAANLRAEGIDVKISHSRENAMGYDVLIYSDAISGDNEEMSFAKDNKLKIFSRGELLHDITKHYRSVISIAGAHGKTSTATMLAKTFECAGLDPSLHIGSGEGFKLGKSGYFITEACEFKKNFLKVSKELAVVLNIDLDHVDCYSSIDELNAGFAEYMRGGRAITCGDCPNCRKAMPSGAITFGLDSPCIFMGKNLSEAGGKYSFDAFKLGEKLGRIDLNVVGKHNVYNALAVLAICDYYEIPFETVRDGIAKYTGAKRRFERSEDRYGMNVIFDYAHHPVEIKATLQAASLLGYEGIICVFEPHTYSRLKGLYGEFCTCFDGAEQLILTKVYSAREKRDFSVSSKKLKRDIKKRGIKTVYRKDYRAIREYLARQTKENRLLLVLGAGDIYNLFKD